MPQNQYFIQNLIEMRAHYQSVIDDAERDSIHATEQLAHINALLVDQLVVNQQFTESLLQLRSHYQALRSEHHQKTQNAKEQIAHVNALLADSLALQHREQQPISIQAATLEQQALMGVMPTADTRNALIVDEGEESQKQEPELTRELKPLEISQRVASNDRQGVRDEAMPPAERIATIAVSSEESPQQNLEVAESLESLQVSESQISTDANQLEHQPELEPPTESPDVEDSPNDSERSLTDKPVPSASSRKAAPFKTPLLPQYQHLTKSSAIENLLHEHSGTILHVDFILRALYGELPPEDITTEMPRINDSLKKGVAKGLWDRVPDEVGCYTADIKLVDSEVEPEKIEEKKRQARKPNSKATEGMLPRYQNLAFTDAVETVLRDRSGEVLTSDIMTRALYGELEEPALVEARNKIGKIMWSGASQGRWQSVPGQKGAYTLTLESDLETPA